MRCYTSLCRASGRQIVIDAVWLESLRLFCPSPVTSEDRLAEGMFDGRLSGSPSGRGWWTRLNRMRRLPFLRLSFLFLPTGVPSTPLHLSNHSETALSPPRAPQWGKWWPKRTRINRRHTKASVPDTWCGGRQSRSDGLMMYLQTVWQRKSVTAGTEAHVTSSAGREKRDWSDVVFVICRELSDHKWTAISPSVHTWR